MPAGSARGSPSVCSRVGRPAAIARRTSALDVDEAGSGAARGPRPAGAARRAAGAARSAPRGRSSPPSRTRSWPGRGRGRRGAAPRRPGSSSRRSRAPRRRAARPAIRVRSASAAASASAARSRSSSAAFSTSAWLSLWRLRMTCPSTSGPPTAIRLEKTNDCTWSAYRSIETAHVVSAKPTMPTAHTRRPWAPCPP